MVLSDLPWYNPNPDIFTAIPKDPLMISRVYRKKRTTTTIIPKTQYNLLIARLLSEAIKQEMAARGKPAQPFS
jgi:hypothetical protein